MSVVTLEDRWVDLGPLHLVITLVDNRRVAYAIAPASPKGDEVAGVLQSDQSMLLVGLGLRGYARAGMMGSARVTVQTPADFLASAAAIEVSHATGRALLAQLMPRGSVWRPVAQATILQAGRYQVLFPAGEAGSGGYIVNTSPPGSDPIWVDPTGAVGSTRSTAAMPVYPALDGASAPGGWRIPPTAGDVTVMGPAGATFQAFSA